MYNMYIYISKWVGLKWLAISLPQKCCCHQHIRTTAIDDWLQNGHVLPQNWPHRNSYAGDFSLEKEMSWLPWAKTLEAKDVGWCCKILTIGTCWNRLRWCSVVVTTISSRPCFGDASPFSSSSPGIHGSIHVHEIGKISGWTVQPPIISEISWYGSKKHQHQNQVKQQKAKIWKKFSFQPLNLQRKHTKKTSHLLKGDVFFAARKLRGQTRWQ